MFRRLLHSCSCSKPPNISDLPIGTAVEPAIRYCLCAIPFSRKGAINAHHPYASHFSRVALIGSRSCLELKMHQELIVALLFGGQPIEWELNRVYDEMPALRTDSQ